MVESFRLLQDTGLAPARGVREEDPARGLGPVVGVRVGAAGRADEREAQRVAIGAVAVFAVVQQCGAGATRAGEISELQGGALRLVRLVLDRAEWDLAGEHRIV